MRVAEEKSIWRRLKNQQTGVPSSPASYDAVTLDHGLPCIVLGGRNGVGKSRLLRRVGQELGDKALFLDLHYLCEQALIVLRSRTDFGDMKDEVDPVGPDSERLNDVQRVIGRKYTNVDWYALEVDPSDERAAERFRWGGEQALLPYFELEYGGVSYTAKDMGLGEFSVHFLFWILEQYRDEEGLTLLLDEPDAYLPPIGVSALLDRLLAICLKRGWRIILSTHSTEMIDRAVDEQGFVLLRNDERYGTVAFHSADEPSAADELVARPPIRHVFFVEDESAHVLATVLMESLDRKLAFSAVGIWGSGAGDLTKLHKHLPKPPNSVIRFTYLYDGDKRDELPSPSTNRWPALCLPTDEDPDDLFMQAGGAIDELSIRLHVPTTELASFLDTMEAVNAHDWVNALGNRYGRQRVLRVLAELWADSNESAVSEFTGELRRIMELQ